MKRILALALITLSTLGGAHDALPSSAWCTQANQNPVLVSTISLTPEEIRDNLQALLSPPAPGYQVCGRAPALRDCGDHPDDWTSALSLATNQCSVYAIGPVTPGNDTNTVIAVVTQPAHFYTGLSTLSLTQNTHHEDYSADQGLSASCMRCVARIPRQSLRTN